MAKKVILDVDTGTDDAIALMVAALSPDLDLIGVTTVDGNTALQNCTENTLRVFDWIGVNIPVYQGCPDPLFATLVPGRRSPDRHAVPNPIHGTLLDLPKAHSVVQKEHAVSWLIQTLQDSNGDITLVPVGPLTNIAMALRMEPRISEKIAEIVLMGGGHLVTNVTPAAEFNFWADPEAARIVVNSGTRIRMVALDATHQAQITVETCERLAALGTPAGEAASKFIKKRIEGHRVHHPLANRTQVPVHDALAVCAVFEPAILQTVFVNVDVEVSSGPSDGRSVCDVRQVSGRAPNVHLALDADGGKFNELLLEILGRS